MQVRSRPWPRHGACGRPAGIALALLAVTGCTRGPGEAPAPAIPGEAAAPQPSPPWPDFAGLYDRTAPSVVSVLARQTMPFLEADRPGFPVAQGMGSGFFFDAEGHLATSAGLVQGAESLQVVLWSGRRLPARLLGRDELSDLAVLAVEAPAGSSRLPGPLEPELGRPPRPGDWVAVLGVPYGLDHTMTAGVLSAEELGEAAPDGPGLLVTDAAVHPGCNGGPLLSSLGRVVGVLRLPEVEADGLGRAVPVQQAWPILESLRAGHPPRRAWLGVQSQDVTLELARTFELPRAQGALVSRVEPGSPAARAGLLRGDVIVSLADRPVEDPTALLAAVRRIRPGRPVRIEIFRQGKRLPLEVTPRPDPRPESP